MLSRFGIPYSYEPGLLAGKLAPSAKLSDCSRKPGNMLVLREEIGNAYCSERNTYGYPSCMAPIPRLFLRHWRDWFSSWRQKALAVLEKTAGTKHYKVNLRAQSQHGTIVTCAHQNGSLAPTKMAHLHPHQPGLGTYTWICSKPFPQNTPERQYSGFLSMEVGGPAPWSVPTSHCLIIMTTHANA